MIDMVDVFTDASVNSRGYQAELYREKAELCRRRAELVQNDLSETSRWH
jgi:hypothetical protein